MMISKFTAGLILGIMFTCAPAQSGVSGNFQLPSPDTPSAQTFGRSLPPIGYVEFCGRGEDECKFSSGKEEKLPLTDAAWAQFDQVNRYVNTKIRPVSDMENYGVADYWTYPVDSGDCEDYVLLKKRYFIGLGISAESLLITVVLDEQREGHAVLTIPTSRGDFVLDNRRKDILLWNQTGYTFLKRQSQTVSNQWVSLQPTPHVNMSQVPVGTRSN